MVVVVIAILASVVLVSYTGISARTRTSTVMNDASVAVQKLEVYKIENGIYPATLEVANNGMPLRPSGDNAYQYTVDNGAQPVTYCLSVTNPALSNGYYVSSTNTAPTVGLCAGHVLNPVVPTNSLTPPANTSNIVIGALTTNMAVNTAYSAYINIGTTATGSPTPTIQWQKLVPKNTDTGTWEDIAGQTNSTLNLVIAGSGCGEGDYCYFRVKYTNSSGTATSAAIKMTLYYESD